MTNLFHIKLYLLTIPVFFAIDMIWLGYASRGFYKNNIGHLMSPAVNWPAAFLFYFVFIAGILVFAVVPAMKDNSPAKGALLGALFGLFTYATYDLTNLATLRNWPVKVVVVDILWGIVLCSSVALISTFLARWLSR